MANEFRLPDIGEVLTDAEIVEWQVKVGDEVSIVGLNEEPQKTTCTGVS